MVVAVLWRPPGAHLYGGGGRKYEIVPTSPDRVPVALGLSAGLVHSEKCEKIRNPTVGRWCFGRLPHRHLYGPWATRTLRGTRSPHQLLARSWLVVHLKRTSTRPIRCRQPAILFGDPVRVSPATRGGRPFCMGRRGEGGDQNTTFPWSDSGFFHTFPSARAPPTIPVPPGLDPATLALFQNFDPRHIQRGPGGLQSTATTNHHHRLVGSRRWLRCVSPVRADAARPLRAT